MFGILRSLASKMAAIKRAVLSELEQRGSCA
jgi:hypothetical protein